MMYQNQISASWLDNLFNWKTQSDTTKKPASILRTKADKDFEHVRTPGASDWIEFIANSQGEFNDQSIRCLQFDQTKNTTTIIALIGRPNSTHETMKKRQTRRSRSVEPTTEYLQSRNPKLAQMRARSARAVREAK